MSQTAGWIKAALAASMVAAALPCAALTLYDPALGLPGAQGWAPLIVGAPASESLNAGRYVFNSMGAGVLTDGRGRVSGTALDTSAGFSLTFALRVTAETHSSANRAGFSFVMVGNDPSHSLELAFWTNEVFAYDYVAADPDRFVHGAGALLDTTASFRSYMLTVQNQGYSLSSGGITLMSGALKDYTAQGLPYTTSNFLFFGDNTSRASAGVELGGVVLSAVPELPVSAFMLLGLGGLALMLKRR